MKNVYFLSDAHLGSRAIEHGRTQERRLVNFLDSIKHISVQVSSVREVLPGRQYFLPQTVAKQDPLTASADDFA